MACLIIATYILSPWGRGPRVSDVASYDQAKITHFHEVTSYIAI